MARVQCVHRVCPVGAGETRKGPRCPPTPKNPAQSIRAGQAVGIRGAHSLSRGDEMVPGAAGAAGAARRTAGEGVPWLHARGARRLDQPRYALVCDWLVASGPRHRQIGNTLHGVRDVSYSAKMPEPCAAALPFVAWRRSTTLCSAHSISAAGATSLPPCATYL